MGETYCSRKRGAEKHKMGCGGTYHGCDSIQRVKHARGVTAHTIGCDKNIQWVWQNLQRGVSKQWALGTIGTHTIGCDKKYTMGVAERTTGCGETNNGCVILL